MSGASDLSSGGGLRRVPRQARAERTLSGLLDAASGVIAEVGYDAATLTAVAARAGVSIGSLYQYFPDKNAVARALAERFGADLADRWAPLVDEAPGLSVSKLVDRMFDVVLGFIADEPAFIPLLTESADYKHVPAVRGRLRTHVAALLRAHQPKLSATEAGRVAEVVVQVIKGMNRSFAKQTDHERKSLVKEFKAVLLGYLSQRLK